MRRRKGREIALMYLFEKQMQKDVEKEVFWRKYKGISAKTKEFALFLIDGVCKNLTQIDELIKRQLQKWRFERLSEVDKNIMRIAVYELLHCPQTPAAVIINEAIELGKIFGGKDSASFINGVLDSVKSIVRKDAKA